VVVGELGDRAARHSHLGEAVGSVIGELRDLRPLRGLAQVAAHIIGVGRVGGGAGSAVPLRIAGSLKLVESVVGVVGRHPGLHVGQAVAHLVRR